MSYNNIDGTSLPSRQRLETILPRLHSAGGKLDPPDLRELMEAARWALHALPDGLDFSDVATYNPLNQVYFRAGLLACREYMARFAEQGGHPETAQSIRANWWPELGPDPGAPRLFNFDEIAEEIQNPDGTVTYRSKEIPPNIEALPRAYQFISARIRVAGDP